MDKCDCEENCKIGCNFLGVIISIAIAVVYGFLVSIGIITVTLNYFEIALAVSAIAIAMLFSVLLIGIFIGECNCVLKCICKIGKCLFFGAIGTLITSTLFVIIGIGTLTIISTVIAALSVFFFVFMIIGIITLVNCLLDKGCRKNK